MRYSLALFDFDGTLCDTGPGIKRSVKYALSRFGIDENDDSMLGSFVGPPLGGSFIKNYGFTEQQAEQAVLYYREKYTTGGLYEAELYPGVCDMLGTLSRAGVTLAVASGKPLPMVRDLARHFGIEQFFSFISAQEDGREQKADIIEHLFAHFGVRDRSRCVMIGDRANDAMGAQKAGVDFIACMYGGYDLPGEFEAFPRVASVNSASEIPKFVYNY